MISIGTVEEEALKAHKELVNAGESVNAWKVSQAALVSLQVDSWSTLGFQIQDVAFLRKLLFTEGKVNAFIHCFVAAQKITTLYDLEVAICKNESIEHFEELGLGPLCRHPLAQHYFLVPSDLMEIFKISSEDVITCLQRYMAKNKKLPISPDELLTFIAGKKSVPQKEHLGVRIHSLGMHVSFIRQAVKSEQTILNNSLGSIKTETRKAQPPSSISTSLEKQLLDQRFDSISERVKSFSSICNVATGKHTHFINSSSDYDSDEYENNVNKKKSNTDPPKVLSSNKNSNSQSCPYPSAAEEMKRLGLKLNSSEKLNAPKDKLMDSQSSRSSGKKRKCRSREKHDDIMKKYLKQDNNLQKGHQEERTTVDLVKEKDSYIFPDADIGKFVATWKEACCKGAVAEVLDLMINFYMPTGISESTKRKIQKIFSRYPGVALIHIAMTSIRRGWLESIYDTVDQIIGDHGSAPSAELLEVGNSVVGNSSVIKDSDLIGNGNIIIDDIINKVAEFCKLNISNPSKALSTKKLFKIMKKFSDCETWLAAQYSVKKFSSLGQGDFYTFLINHASQLPEVMHNFTNVKSSEPSRVSVCMHHQQLELLLSQTEWNQSTKGEITKSYVSLLLCKQFPTTSFQISGNNPDEFFSDLIKSKRNRVNSTCIVYSVSLTGNQLLKTSEDIIPYDSILSKEALKCLLKVPMLSDLLSWSHWNAIYASSLGSLSDWLLNQVDTTELLCIATMDGKFIRIDHSATVDEFLEAMIESSSSQVALKMLSILSLHGGISNAPVSLLKCYAQRAVDILINNTYTDTHHDIGDAATNLSRFVLECLEYLPSEFRIFGYDILVSGLQSVVKDAHSRILRECSLFDQRLMLHDIGLTLGIREWIADLHTFNSSYTSDLLISSKTLRKSLPHCDSGENRIIAESQKPLSNDIGTSLIIDENLHDDCNMIREESSDIDSVGHQENPTVQDATSFVELIRREEFGLDSNLNGSESCIVKKQHARLGRALHCLSQELYSQDSHLLLELVQNADDNIYPVDVDPTLVFILHESGIVVLNNEKGFSAQNIRALCDIGNSTKKGSGAGYIGKKGIGFKSVFRVTDAPEIHSNGFHVKFDITEGQIGFVLPTVIAPVDVKIYSQLLSGKTSSDDAIWKTCIVLPFRSKSKDVADLTSIITMFSDLHPSLLLFLHRLRCIKFMNKVKNTLVNMRREILGNGIVKVTHGQDTMNWLVVSKKLAANHIRPDVETTEIALAFTLEENESREYKPNLSPQPVFAFLPLRHYGLKFILQGDFVLPSSREEVDGNSAWNQWLLSEFPALYVSAEKSFGSLPCFLKCPGKAVTIYLSFVPNIGEVHGFFSHLPQMIVSRLRTSNCLLLDDPDPVWVLPCKALRGWNQQARRLLSIDLLQKHIGVGYLNRDIELSDALARSLGVQEYGPKVLVEVISSICQSKDGISSLGLDWIAAWLSVLHSTVSVNVRMEDDVINSLRKITFIPLSSGLYSSVADGTIWLPCSSSVNIEGKYSAAEFPGLYAKLRTVNPLLFSASADNMYSEEEIKRVNLVYMLNKIGVQQLSAHEIIKSHILVALSNGNCMDRDKMLYIEYLVFIMLHFQHECERCLSDRKDIILELQKHPVILTNHGYKGTNDESIHFGNDYKNPVDMRKLIGGTDLKWHEVDVDYLNHPSIQSLPFGVMKCRTFFMELGITDFVKVTCIKRNISDSTYDDWESEELLRLLSAFSSNKCREKCIYLLEVLDRMWDDVYNTYSRSSIVSNSNESQGDCKSLFLQQLVEYRWIASTMDQDLHQSKDLFYDCDEVRSILGDFAPYAIPKVTSKYLCKDIGFKTKVSLDDALNLLRIWRESRVSLKSRFSILQMTKFYAFIFEALARSNPSVIEDLKSSSFIFVPYLHTFKHEDIVCGTYLSPKELFWHDPTGCVDKSKELYACYALGDNEAVPITSLAVIYPGLYDFFLNKCGVPKNPSFSSYLQIILQLSSTVPPSQLVDVVFQVYVKWATDFKSGLIDPVEILEFKENLLKLEHTVLPTSQDKWVSLHPSYGLVCWPDDDELKQQFKQCIGLDFLHFGDVSKEDREKFFGKVATFLHQMGVPALSEIVSREAIFYGTHDNREKAAILTWILQYAQRYLYKLHPVIYNNMRQNGVGKLSQLQVTVVDELYFKNSLKGLGTASKKRFACSCLLQGNTLYTTLSANFHSIFLELSRIFFNGSTELQFANFLHMITTMAESGSTDEQTEFFILNSQKIPKLPNDEPIWCFSSLAQIPNIQKSQSISSSPLTNNIDNIATPVSQNKTPVSSNWPPTNWKTAPDAKYARANYHLTKPHAEEISIQNEIIIDEDSLMTNLNNSESDPAAAATSTSNTKKEAFAERENLRFETQYDEQQLKQTGQLGEAVAYKYFTEKYGAENVKWVNERNETGLPYDLVIGVDESNREYIEVKATKSARKDWFEVSAREWQFATEKGEFYTVAHVLLGHNKASVTVLKNPVRLCQQNKLHLALLMSANVKPKYVDI